MRKFTTVLTSKDYLDVTLHIYKKKILKFALNYRSHIGNKWFQIYRVDNFHGFLHEQKFWRGPDPIPIEDRREIIRIVEGYTDKIVMNFTNYKGYFKKVRKNEKK